MLVELGVVEQRYRAVLEVLDGASVTEWRAGMGWRVRRCMSGCAGMRTTVVWRLWRTGRRGRGRVRIRCRRRSRRGSWRCAGRIRRGGRDGSVAAGAGGCRAAAGPLSGVSGAGAPRPGGRRQKRQAAPGGLPAVGAGRAMELWQMDVVGRFFLADGTELKMVTGIDDHSRFVCLRKAGGAGHGPAGVRRAGRGVGPPRGAGADPDR